MIKENRELHNRERQPARYELLSRHGRVHGTYSSAQRAAEVAQSAWPGEEQDEDRTGKGWDIQVVGSDRQ